MNSIVGARGLGVNYIFTTSTKLEAMGSENPAEAAGSSSHLPASQLPWQQIPSFDPQTTDIQVYTRKLQFLKDIWPSEHISQLAPRAALQVQGVAFQKVARLDAAKLKAKLAAEEKLSFSERAFYQTIQKSDETNDSYLARHDVAFEDIETHNVTMKEVRAYVLLRQSQLSGEDRKRIVIESAGDLTYEKARKAMRLLGSRFFQDLHGVHKGTKHRTYDINQVEPNEEAFITPVDEEWDEELAFQAMLETGDEDAAFVADFEDTIVEAVQDS